ADVLVGARSEGNHAIASFRLRRQQDDGNRGRRRRVFHLREQLDPARVGQERVEDDQGIGRPVERRPRRRGGRAGGGGTAGGLEGLSQVHPHRETVVDDEDV